MVLQMVGKSFPSRRAAPHFSSSFSEAVFLRSIVIKDRLRFAGPGCLDPDQGGGRLEVAEELGRGPAPRGGDLRLLQRATLSTSRQTGAVD
jgi:hypothetical protein